MSLCVWKFYFIIGDIEEFNINSILFIYYYMHI